MEIYDTVNRLAEEIRSSSQYKNLKESKEKLFADQQKKSLIEEFEKLKQEVKKVKVAKLYNVLIENKDIKEYFDYEIEFSKMIADINKIIGDAIKEVI